jgi:tetratricopeptide (TPR) repeat protein
MSDPLRTDPAQSVESATDTDRDAKIEQLLLVGLDHYFAAEYEQAINVWSRALFLDRSHARARAYIERARSALAERQRRSEELLHHGAAAFDRGEGEEARRLLEAALNQGAPSDQALALLDRINRLERGAVPSTGVVPRAAEPAGTARAAGRGVGARTWVLGASAVALLAAAAAAIFAVPNLDAWRSMLGSGVETPAVLAAPSSAERPLPVPRRGETALVRARALAGAGRLHDAIAVLESVRLTDPGRPEADRLRADLQKQLLAVSAASR